MTIEHAGWLTYSPSCAWSQKLFQRPHGYTPCTSEFLYLQELGDSLKIVKIEADPCPNLMETYKVGHQLHLYHECDGSMAAASRLMNLNQGSYVHQTFLSVAGVWLTHTYSFQGWQGCRGEPARRRYRQGEVEGVPRETRCCDACGKISKPFSLCLCHEYVAGSWQMPCNSGQQPLTKASCTVLSWGLSFLGGPIAPLSLQSADELPLTQCMIPAVQQTLPYPYSMDLTTSIHSEPCDRLSSHVGWHHYS